MSLTPPQTAPPRRFPTAAPLLLVCCLIAGCAPTVGRTKSVDVTARYRGLEGRSVAVLVAANDYLLYQHPDAARSVCVAVTNRIALNLPTVTVVSPQQVAEFQTRNPFWTTLPYDELVARVGVDRIVLIDLSEYRTHEPGNAHVWQGFVAGDVGVIEAENTANDVMAFRQPVSVRYPDRHELGVLDSDEQSIQLGMLAFFSRDAAGLFYDHRIEVKQ